MSGCFSSMFMTTSPLFTCTVPPLPALLALVGRVVCEPVTDCRPSLCCCCCEVESLDGSCSVVCWKYSAASEITQPTRVSQHRRDGLSVCSPNATFCPAPMTFCYVCNLSFLFLLCNAMHKHSLCHRAVSVRLSVRLSRSCILSKRINRSSKFVDHPPDSQTSIPNVIATFRPGPDPPPLTGASNVGKNRDSR